MSNNVFFSSNKSSYWSCRLQDRVSQVLQTAGNALSVEHINPSAGCHRAVLRSSHIENNPNNIKITYADLLLTSFLTKKQKYFDENNFFLQKYLYNFNPALRLHMGKGNSKCAKQGPMELAMMVIGTFNYALQTHLISIK